MQLFDEKLPFFKGNLHCHTTRSDGSLSPERVKAFYRSRGYDFLALTDHRLLSEQSRMEDHMLMLPGAELDFMYTNDVVHIVGIGMHEGYDASKGDSDPQACVNRIIKYGGRAILCHPAWSLNTPERLCAYTGFTAAEIYNSTSTIPWNGDRADSSVLLDIAATRGARFNFVASDDSHKYEGEAGRSATMVQAESLTQESLLSAMDAGRFYCTQGPRFEQISVTGRYIEVRCSPVRHIVFYSNLVWAMGRCLSGDRLSEGIYDLAMQAGERFVRVQLIDENGDSAWSNPIWLNERR